MHYVNVFKFIGQAGLSQKYFTLMGKRISENTNFPEFDEKQRLFEKLKYESVKLRIYGKNYLGNIEAIERSAYLFAGFDEGLLSVQGFLNFVDYEEEKMFRQNENVFQISTDGICYGYIHDLKSLEDLGAMSIDTSKIPFYWDNFTIRDVDYMLHFQLVEFIKYLFVRNHFEIKQEIIPEEKEFDFVVRRYEKEFGVEVKKDVIIKTFDQLKNQDRRNVSLLVTAVNVSDEDIEYAKKFGILIIDRRRLKLIIYEERKIWGYLRQLVS